jgi:hypothetical protein
LFSSDEVVRGVLDSSIDLAGEEDGEDIFSLTGLVLLYSILSGELLGVVKRDGELLLVGKVPVLRSHVLH